MKNKKEISIRIWLAFTVLTLLGIGILTKIFIIQLNEGAQWKATGKNFEQKVRTITPERGQILSSDGRLLATSVPVYSVYWDSQCDGLQLNMDKFNNNLDSLCDLLSNYFKNKTKKEYKSLFQTAISRKNRYTKIVSHIDFIQKKEIEDYPIINWGRYKSGFVFDKINKREKPFGKLAARTIGIDRNGQRVGLESAYHTALAGREGQQLQEKIAGSIWKPITDDFIVEPLPGLDLVTSIDVHLQDLAENALEKQLKINQAQWGCVVLMEVETGYVKAIANLTRDTTKSNLEYNETYNYAVGSAVEPGSTFKLASMMAALESGIIEPTDTIDMGVGTKKFYNSWINDSNKDKGGHGKGTVADVFKWSSNIGMAEISDRCFKSDKQQLLDFFKTFGLQDRLGLHIKGEPKPKIYSKIGEGNWSGISHLWMAFGYEVAQTPLQTLAFYNSVANDGKLMRPLFARALRKNGKTVEKIEPVVLRQGFCSSNTLKDCQKMMESVCQKGGTAEQVFKNSNYSVAGKTGTAWLFANGRYNKGHYRGSFVGYFPTNKPKYSCIVVIHDPSRGAYYGSAIAAPVFKTLADHLYSTELYEPTPPNEASIAQTNLPISKNGDREALNHAFAALGIETKENSQSTWISTATKKDYVVLNEKTIEANKIPDVRGMGLQDALFLLENAGLHVEISGYGVVKKQSLSAGRPALQGTSIKIELD